MVPILITVASVATILLAWDVFKKAKFKELLVVIKDTMADGELDDSEKITLIAKIIALFKKDK